MYCSGMGLASVDTCKVLQNNSSKETREGQTYCSGMGLASVDTCKDTLNQIPPPNPIPATNPLLINKVKETQTAVFFYLETTGLARSSHITQLAAISDEKTFSSFILPKQEISKDASMVTGITIRDGTMYHAGEEVNAAKIQSALKSFLSFLKSFQKKIVLVGHNILSFDCRVLHNALHSCDMVNDYRDIVDGYVDTLKYFRSVNPGLKSYKQEVLCQNHNIKYREHDARGDVYALQCLCRKECFELQSVGSKLKCTCDFESVEKMLTYCKTLNKNLPSLQPLINRKVLSKSMARKVAGSGLNYNNLDLAFQRDPGNGIKNLFYEQTCTGTSRVTKSSKIVAKVVEHFSTLREC